MAIFYWLLYGLKWKCWRIYNFCCNLFWVYWSIVPSETPYVLWSQNGWPELTNKLTRNYHYQYDVICNFLIRLYVKWNQLWHTKMLDGIYTWELIELFTLVSENHIIEYSVFIVLILCLKISVASLSRNCVLNPKGYVYFDSVVLRVSTQKSKNK